MLIDMHTHLFPDALAARTLPHLSKTAFDSPYYTDGTLAGTLDAMEKQGVDYAAILHIATRDGHQQTINHFAVQLQEQYPRLLCFGTVYPKADGALEEVARIKRAGLHGIKLHPAYQSFFFGDECYFPLYEAIANANLPLILHAGLDPVSPINYSPADQIARVANAFPTLTLIAAHMGAMGQAEQAERYLCDADNLYFDTAMSSVYLEPTEYARLIRRRGVEHILFGTDCPWNTVENELGMLSHLGLTADELEQIKWKNAAKLLKISL